MKPRLLAFVALLAVASAAKYGVGDRAPSRLHFENKIKPLRIEAVEAASEPIHSPPPEHPTVAPPAEDIPAVDPYAPPAQDIPTKAPALSPVETTTVPIYAPSPEVPTEAPIPPAEDIPAMNPYAAPILPVPVTPEHIPEGPGPVIMDVPVTTAAPPKTTTKYVLNPDAAAKYWATATFPTTTKAPVTAPPVVQPPQDVPAVYAPPVPVPMSIPAREVPAPVPLPMPKRKLHDKPQKKHHEMPKGLKPYELPPRDEPVAPKPMPMPKPKPMPQPIPPAREEPAKPNGY